MKNKTPIISTKSSGGTTPPNEIFQFSIDLPSGDGPLAEFTKLAESLGIAPTLAWATWHYCAVSCMSYRTVWKGSDTRANINVILAGNEAGSASALIEIARSAISASVEAQKLVPETDIPLIVRNLQVPIKDAHFEILATRPSLWLFARNADEYLPKWSSPSKQPWSISDVCRPEQMDVGALSIGRLPGLGPAAASLLGSCTLTAMGNLVRHDQSVFEDALVVPSFGTASRPPLPTAIGTLLKPLQVTCTAALQTNDTEIELSKDAAALISSWIDGLGQAPHSHSLADEQSSAYRRLSGILTHTVAVAFGYAVNDSLRDAKEFSGEISKKNAASAIEAIGSIHRGWHQLDETNRRSAYVAPAIAAYQRIVTDFEKYDTGKGRIRVKFAMLTAKFCHHPGQRDNMYPNDFRYNILRELVERRLAVCAERIGKTEYWEFPTKGTLS